MTPMKFADLHHHVLWGMDDGPQTPEQMQAQLSMACQNDIALIAATCHASPLTQPFDMKLYQARLAEANACCRQAGWPVQVVQGCEIQFSSRVPDLLTDGALPTLGNSRYVLLEFVPDISSKEMASAVNRLYQAGFWPIIAHAERCRCLLYSPKRAMELREDMNLVYQINCSTLLQPHGFFERRFIRSLVEAHAIDLIATDAHNLTTRAVNMRQAFQYLHQQDPELAEKLHARSWQIIANNKTK